METIGVDLKSHFGSFTKPFSTSGGLLTYKVPPKPAIRGMLGSMAGFSFKDTLNILEGLKCGVIPLSNIQTKTTTFNSHYGNPRGRMVNIRQELLIDPHYRVIIDFSEVSDESEAIERMSLLLEENGEDANVSTIGEGYYRLMKNQISFYQLYMGRNNFPLEVNTVNIDLEEIKDPARNEYETECIVPRELVSTFRVEEAQEVSSGDFGFNVSVADSMKFHILKDIPVKQNESREYTELKDFIMKSQNEQVKLIVEPKSLDEGYKYLRDEGGSLYFLY